jgi:hypothetical protein
LGFAILGQKQYTSALVRYWAAVRAEVFQSSFVLFLYICFSIGQRFRAEEFQIPQHRKALSLCATSPQKMKVYFIISLFVLTLQSSGQALVEIKQLLEKKDFKTFENYITKSAKKYSRVNPYSNVRVIWQLKSNLTPLYQECVVDVDESFPDKDDSAISTVERYRINILTSAKEIIYYDFSEKVNRTASWFDFSLNVLDSFRNENLLIELDKNYLETYKTSLNRNELFIDTCVYGSSCNLGQTPELREELNTFIENKDIIKINNWLTSQIAEKQVYAIDALYQLRKKGYKFTSEQKRLIEIISEKKDYINICRGCITSSILLRQAITNIKKGRFM